jgi:hypothetical protein
MEGLHCRTPRALLVHGSWVVKELGIFMDFHHPRFSHTIWLFNIAMEHGPVIDGLYTYLKW